MNMSSNPELGERFSSRFILPTVKIGGWGSVWECFSHRQRWWSPKDHWNNEERRVPQHSPAKREYVWYRSKWHWVFQLDNDPKHTSKLCKKYLENIEIGGELNSWTAARYQSHRAWWKVKILLPTNQNDIWNCLVVAWENIQQHKLHNLVERLPRICAAIIKARGARKSMEDHPCLVTGYTV